MAEDQAPPVVAVVVSSDPGPWLEECLRSLVAQDYTNLSLLVVDSGSDVPFAARVAAVAPQAYFHRLEHNAGFGPSANVVLSLVEGATHFVICHDDVVLDVECVHRLVEETFRSNAGIAAPKLVDYDEPDRILQLGLGVDRFGAPVRRVERREFDQAQHDEPREVFAVPGGATLIRADLFRVLGGFDEQISMFGEDVDICWRARLAGARVVVVPQATARHLEATASRRRPLPNARDLQWRHELRAVLKNYGRLRRAIVVFELVLLSVVEAVYFLASGRRHRAGQVLGAWRWNTEPQRQLKTARRSVEEYRRLPDRRITPMLARRTSRLWRFVRPYLESRALRYSHRRLRPTVDPDAPPRRPKQLKMLFGFAVVLIVFGSRSLLFGHLPLIGQYLPLPSPGVLLGHFFAGYDDALTQHPGPASPAFLFLGLSGGVLLGAMGLLFKVAMIALVVLAARGTAKVIRPFASSTASLIAGIAYVFLPLCWNDVARGNVVGLITFATVPYLVARLFRATGLSPFGSDERRPLRDRTVLEEVLGLAVLTGVAGAFDPLVIVLLVVLGILTGIGCAVSAAPNAATRAPLVALGGAVGAVVLLFPWSITYLQTGTYWSVLTGAATNPATTPGFGSILRFDVGPIGSGVLSWASLAAAILVLLVANGERLQWATRLWAIALGSALVAWVAALGWFGPGGGDTNAFLAPLALAVAGLIGVGVSSIRDDVTSAHIGWRHLGAIAFGLLGILGALPVLGATLGGRWSAPDSGYDVVLSWMNVGGANANDRTLWLGDPEALPFPAWQIAPGLSLALSEGLPDAQRYFLSPNPGEARALMAALAQAEDGRTVRLGHLLAAHAIRYVVVPTAYAPRLAGTQSVPSTPPPEVVLDGLVNQSDLRQLPSEGGALVFANSAWHPGTIPPLSPGATPAILRDLAVALEVALFVALIVYYARRRRSRRIERRAVARAERGTSGATVVTHLDRELVAP